MGFWSNTKVLIASSSKALGNGLEIAAEGAKYLEKQTDYALLKVRIEDLVDKKELAEDKWFEDEYKSDRDELLGLYKEITQKYRSRCGVKYLNAIGDDRNLERKYKLKKQRFDIVVDIKKIDRVKFRLPINKINHINRIITKLNLVMIDYQRENDDEGMEWSSLKIKELENCISKLEILREENFLECYDDGSVKREYIKKDGSIDGLYEEFFESGQRSFSLKFDNGSLVSGFMYDEHGSVSADFDKYANICTVNSYSKVMNIKFECIMHGSKLSFNDKSTMAVFMKDKERCFNVNARPSLMENKFYKIFKFLIGVFSFKGMGFSNIKVSWMNYTEGLEITCENYFVFIDKIEEVCSDI